MINPLIISNLKQHNFFNPSPVQACALPLGLLGMGLILIFFYFIFLKNYKNKMQ